MDIVLQINAAVNKILEGYIMAELKGSRTEANLMAAFAGGNVGHNHLSVSAFGQTSLVMSILAIISAVIVVLYIKDEIHDLM